MNELQTILAETCTRLFTDHATTAVLEGAEKGQWPAALWQALEENGLTLPQVPEARGGAGGSWNGAFAGLMASRRFRAPVPRAAPLRGRLGPHPTWAGGALVRSAQMAGGLEFLLAQSVKYVTERKQFGRPLAAFQAIQQNLALLAGHTASAAMAAQQAFHVVERTGEGGDASFEIAVAKVRTGEASGLGAGIAHQAHGAIGFTYEHSLHFVTRRLWSWRAEVGAESHWSVALGREVAARGGGGLWPHT